MRILDWLSSSMQELKKAGVDSPRRDCLVLLEDLLDKERSWITAHADFELSEQQTELLNQKLTRRIKREPLAYIRGKAWFYGRFFDVNSAVMVPRPESESFIDFLNKLKPETIIDIGTGSGCLAISAKIEFPKSEVIAVDNDVNALQLAKENANKYEVKIEFTHSNLFSDKFLSEKTSDQTKNITIMTNLPYVPEGLINSPEIEYEPDSALFSGTDGMEHYKSFWKEMEQLPNKPLNILVESLETQHKQQLNLAQKAGYVLLSTDILVQHYERN